MNLTQVNYRDIESGIGLKFSGQSVGAVISEIVTKYLFTIAGILLLLYFIFGGFQYLTSAGDPKKAQEAQNKITQALIGFVIIFASYWIVQIIANLLGLGIIKQTFK
ncbi:MAG: hypothetical protein KatS3mg088_115 [Patescibacteria group bacterium]|nr:MAG: hypothetical protein KatS3mg088_115 [Patescibacteria group bacterium]